MTYPPRRPGSLLPLSALAFILVCACSLPPASRDGSSGSAQDEERHSGRGVGDYFHDRLQDLRDVAGAAVTVGPGLLAHARATQIFQVGGGYYTGYKLGTWHRSAGVWEQSETSGGAAPLFWIRTLSREGIYGDIIDIGVGDSDCDKAVSFWAFLIRGDLHAHTGPDEQRAHDLDQSFWDIGAGVHIGLIGLDAYVNPMEMLDFLLGWFGVDFMRDDYGASYRTTLRSQAAPRPVWREAAVEAAEEQDTAVLPYLMTALSDDRYDEFALEAIVSIGGEEAVPGLIRLQADPASNHTTRDSAIEALGRLAGQEGLSPAVKEEVTQALLSTLEDPRWAFDAALALRRFAGWTVVPAVMKQIVGDSAPGMTRGQGLALGIKAWGGNALETDRDFWILWWERERERHPELKGLPGYDLEPGVFEAAHRSASLVSLLSRLRNGTADARDLQVVNFMVLPETLPPLRTYLEGDLHAADRMHATEALARLEGRNPVEVLFRFARDEDPEIRREAVARLTFLRDRRMVLFYIHLLRERILIVRIRARIGLQVATKEGHVRGHSKWIQWWRAHRDEYPPQVLPPGLTEEDVLGGGESP